MNKLSLSVVSTLIVLSASSLACAAHAPAASPSPSASTPITPPAATHLATPAPSSPAPVSSASHEDTPRPVYRFDFVLTSSDGTSTPTNTSFTLNLEEWQKGELMAGKNVPLTAAPPPPPTAGAPVLASVGPRQDVGLKVVAQFKSVGQDLLLNIDTEMSALDPPTGIRKLTTRGNALATPGKSAVVATLQDAHVHYQLTVTPTRLK